jgi:DNA (cytosine-5)-methyltransferase 1
MVYAYLIKYYGSICANAVDVPVDTLTSRDRFALITVHEEQYIVKDIYMRFLTPRETYDMTGFPGDYIIDRDADGNGLTRENQVARCGNAVTPPVAAALVRANLPEYCKTKEIQ